MSLSNLIRRKSEPVGFATATPATFATQEGERGRTVASVASVAVAKSPQGQTAPPVKVSPGDTATAILERHPDAVAAEPFTPTIRRASAPMTASDESAIRAWLALIEETDPATIAEVIGQCQRDADAREYFTGRAAAELPKPDAFPDDRLTCSQCSNLTCGGVCSVASPGGVVSAIKGYRPVANVLQRCAAFNGGNQ